jgi:hypothetical protein
MEGNPFVRWTMARVGIGWALFLEKAAAGLAPFDMGRISVR